MTKMLKVLGVLVLVAVGVFLALNIFLATLSAPPWQGKRELERDFNKNRNAFFIVRDFLAGFEYETISINLFDKKMFIGPNVERIQIDNTEVSEAIQLLFNSGYLAIDKKSGCVSFLRWSGKDAGCGAVYSIDGREPDESSLQFLTKLVPLAEDGWYYYEENFNEWKLRNQTQ